jgi:predicted component of type VI protein secretion system
VKRSIFMTITIAALALAACDKTEEKKDDPASKNSTTTGATTTTTTTPTAAPAPVVIADTDLSTPADFEEAAEKAITTKNYKAEIATMEKDIDKE